MPAFVFPGQGSQRPGMGRPWVDHASWELVRDASDASGRDLQHLLLDADAAELTETRNAQLATFTLSLVVLDAVERLGIEPTACAGHSVGEYTALVATGALGFEAGFRLVAERGDAMQASADDQPGIMLMVAGSDAETVDIACRLADGPVWLANDNSTDEVVIAGEETAVRRAGALALEMGARTLAPVAVGGAFHTPFMASARNRLTKALRTVTFRRPDVPVVANVDARAHTDAEGWERLLVTQLTSPVRWRQAMARLGGLEDQSASAEHLFVELGPGSALTRLAAQSLPGMTALAVTGPDDLDRLVEALAADSALHMFASGHQGEHLYVSERMVISPCAGVFQPADGEEGHPATDDPVDVGSLLGTVSGVEVRSAFAGSLMGMLAHPGERVQTGQPIAWLRAR
ncbi:MAG TPA: acyltransferase domain-containing protein [Acidimicrobiales bacterium]|nr:acyltransferase domain-containing protein [Acidimicrobiales bacterium]